MTSKERVKKILNHQPADKVAIDFGGTAVTGIHVRAVDLLRKHYGLDNKPIKVIEPYQMLGEIEEDLAGVLGIDIIGLTGKKNMFGITQDKWKEWKTPWLNRLTLSPYHVLLLPRHEVTKLSSILKVSFSVNHFPVYVLIDLTLMSNFIL